MIDDKKKQIIKERYVSRCGKDSNLREYKPLDSETNALNTRAALFLVVGYNKSTIISLFHLEFPTNCTPSFFILCLQLQLRLSPCHSPPLLLSRNIEACSENVC